MKVQICTETDPGLERAQNEDAVAFDAATGLCILADGMGGHNAGEVASGMATAFIKSELRDWVRKAGKRANMSEVQSALLQAVDKANSAIFNMSRANSQYSGMGTTLVVGVFHRETLVLAHIGDSRCYRLRDGKMQQMTKDHSVHQEQIDAGLWGVGQKSGQGSMRDQNLVTRALGVDAAVLTDINRHALEAGDVYLMCSDGLSDMVGDDAIAAILREAETIEHRARKLVDAANAGGGRDNISVLLAQVDGQAKPGLLGSARKMLRAVWPGAKYS
jgi:serine/threonine protein phosphatase PrpC